jgi:glycosyltransferase involved in cell wall biosynthesis
MTELTAHARRTSFFLPDLSGGGAERALVQLARAYRADGDSVEILLARPGGRAVETQRSGIPVQVLGNGRTSAVVPALARHLRRTQPAVLVSALTHANVVAIVARRLAHAGTKVVVTEHANIGYVTGTSSPLRSFAYRASIGMIYRDADAVVAVSNGTAQALAVATRLPLRAIDVIPNIIDVDQIRSAATASLPLTISQAPLVVAIGRLERVKGFDILIEAFREVRDRTAAQLVIAGEGSQREPLARMVRALRLESDVQFPGFLSNPYPLLAHASVLALPSRSEALPTALLEAFALRVPVVATDCPTGPGELLNGRFGQLVPVENPAAMADALVNAIQGRATLAPDRVLDAYTAARVTSRYRQLTR